MLWIFLIPFVFLLQQFVITYRNRFAHYCCSRSNNLILQHPTPIYQQTMIKNLLPIVATTLSLLTTNPNTNHLLITRQPLLFAFYPHTSFPSCWNGSPWSERLDRLHIHILWTPSHSHEAVLTTRTLPTTTPTSLRHWRILRTSIISLIVFTASMVSLPMRMLLHAVLHLQTVEEQDAL